jgi:beta-glucosidase
MKSRFILFLATMIGCGLLRASDNAAIYLDATQPLENRVEDLLSRLTTEEKISLIHADSKFTTAAIPRLGIPRRWLDDGPHGVREDIGPDTWAPAGRTDDFSTAMPAGICLAATWNPELGFREGEAIGQEARARGKDIMLAPGVNILRTPLCGRNFEYLGEDPFLASQMCVGYIRGEQSQDVASCVKHFALNNQEFERDSINVEVDERALREIYLPAFKAAVQEAGVWSVMGAYNKFRGQHCCENDFLLNKILKDEWDFKGLVMSDWAGAHDTRECALNGLDLEMGTEKNYNNFYFAQPYLNLLKSGELPMTNLDEKVRRNLRVMLATHVLDSGRKIGSLNTAAHQEVARKVAEEGIVLLKNEKKLLPLDAAKLKTIAVIGENATRLHAHGGDSSGIKAFYEITPLQGIIAHAGKNVNVIYSEGYQKNGDANLEKRAIAAAKSADAVIYIGGLNHDKGFDCEGADRTSMKLPYGQDELIQKIVAANPKTIVVLEGTMVEMDAWLKKVPAVLQAWYPGMEGGNALARVLFGDVNPSGKLPATFPKKLSDSPAHALGNYPGKNGTVTYAEGLLVGYRWFDTKNIEPQFPFGFGLSYTTFKYADLKLIPGTNGIVTAQFEIENTGTRAGAEVAQLYVHEKNPDLMRPEKELKGFKKVFLQPGEKQTVSIPLTKAAFAYYNDSKKSWVAQNDHFEILIGSSSRDIRLRDHFDLATGKIRVACVGDSITFGWGLHPTYPARLGQWLGTNYDVRNFGVSAKTLLHRADQPYIREAAYTNALAFEPDIVVINFGANDSKHPGDGSLDADKAVNNWQFKSDFIGDYKDMIASFRKANPTAKIFVCFPTPDFPGRWGINDKTIREEMIPMIRTVANETGASVIDLNSTLAGKADLFPDTVHPNTEGAKMMAAEIFRALTGKSPPEIPESPAQKNANTRQYNLFSPYFAWNNNSSREEIGWQPGTEDAPQWTASFNFSTNGLYGYPASIRGWHYGWNPTGDSLFPKKLSETASIPCSFSYNCGGDDLHGDFAYDMFLRRDDRKAEPQLEVMVWAGNNSTPIGAVLSTNVTVVENVVYDLWGGTNASAGYYVYSFVPHQKTAAVPTEGSLNVDMMDFFHLLSSREHFSLEMYLNVVEAGFEIVRGSGWVTCGWFSCEAIEF